MEEDETGRDVLAHTLDIDSDYIRLPSAIKERLDQITDLTGKEYEIASHNMVDLMKIGGEAISDMASLAAQSQHPRMFEVLTALMQTMFQANRELMEMKKLDVDIKIKEGKTDDNSSQPTNNILVCSPAELLQMMKKQVS